MKVYRALGEPTRLAVVRMLAESGEREVCCTEITERLKIPASTLSHHLTQLVNCGLLSWRKNGTFRIYKVERDALARYAPFLL